MKIALIQLNPTVADLEGNARLIAQAVHQAQASGASLAVSSELALLGYPPRDLLLHQGFIQRAWQTAQNLAVELADGIPLLMGLARPNPADNGRPLFNAAVLLHRGRIAGEFYKTLLPSYDVFDEDRYFEPAQGPQVLNLDGCRLGVSICEDVWNDRDFWGRQRYHTDPIQELAAANVHALLNLSASPFTLGKQALRERMLAELAVKHRLPLLYVNQVGGNDDLVFDGRSCAFDIQGRLFARAQGFAPDLLLVDLADLQSGASADGRIAVDDFTPESETWRALVLGTRDYAQKCGFRQALLGLSGGIDSSITAAIAAEALGSQNVLGVLLPSPFSSRGSLVDAQALSRNLGIRTLTLPIEALMQAYQAALQQAFANYPQDVTEENIQARIRGNLLMALSNKYGALLLTTGNKSELAVGYCTLYGDMSGGLAVISDLPKTAIYRLARWLNRVHRRAVIPRSVLTKPPSAELRPNQTDQDSLPPYDILDQILALHVEGYQSAAEIIAQGFEAATVYKVIELVRKAEFKRQQAAPGLKVTDRAFGAGWRMPIVRQAWEKP